MTALSLVAAFGVLLFPAAVHAADFSFEASMTYDIEATGKAVVTEKYTATNLTSDRVLSDFTVNAPSSNISAVSARTAAGQQIDVSTDTATRNSGDIEYEYTQIKLNLSQAPKGKNKKLSFTVSYVAEGIAERAGAARGIFIPGIGSGAEGVSYSVEVKTPIEFGLPKTGADNVSRSGVIAGKQFFSFSGSKLTDNRVSMLFGDTSVYNLNLKTQIKNRWPWPRTVSVTLPPELASQRVFVRALNPAPANTSLDRDSNILAEYRLKPFQSMTVETEVLVEVRALKYDLAQSSGFDQIPPSMERYTEPTFLWPTDGEVAAKAAELADREAPVIKTVESIYNFVTNELSYNAAQLNIESDRVATRPLDVPEQGIASDYSNLLTAMLRSQGIPARTIVGYAPGSGLKVGTEPRDVLHTWVETFVPGVGWMTLDPVWGEKFDHFGLNTVDHIALSVWGSGKQPLPAGGGTGYMYEDMLATLSEDSLPELSLDNIDFAVTRYVALPFVSIEQVRTRGATGYSVDNFAAQVGNRQILIGSLAPSESKSVNKALLGSGWNQAAAATLHQVIGGEPVGEELAATTANVSYMPLIVLVAIIVISIIVGLVWRRRRAHKILGSDKVGHDIEQDDIIGDGQDPEPIEPQQPASTPPIEAHNAPGDFTPVTPTDAEVEQAAREVDDQQADAIEEAPAPRPKNERNYVPRPQPSIDGMTVTRDRAEKLISDHPDPDDHKPGDMHPPGGSNSTDESV